MTHQLTNQTALCLSPSVGEPRNCTKHKLESSMVRQTDMVITSSIDCFSQGYNEQEIREEQHNAGLGRRKDYANTCRWKVSLDWDDAGGAT